MTFVGREKEIKDITERLHSNRFEGLFIYGRRRVGKSELIKECIKRSDVKAISYVCRESLFKDNFSSLCRIVTVAFDEEYLSFTKLEDLLTYVFRKAEKEPLILFIDEYPLLRAGAGKAGAAAVDSEFQIAIDQYRNTSNLKLILCGSYIDMMKEIIEADKPLYGRFQYQLNLKPFDYYDAAKFFPSCSNVQKFEYYSRFGGIPYFLKEVRPEDGLESNIERLLITPDSLLENEIKLRLSKELAKSEGLNTILDAIGAGKKTYTDLNNIYGDGSHSNALYVINKLIDMELIEKISAINEPNNKKAQTYSIMDNMLDFYYSYLFRHSSERAVMSETGFYYKFVKRQLKDVFLPRQFEKAAKEFLIRMNRIDRVAPPFTSIGKYVYHDRVNNKNGEFDVVTEDEDGFTYYECKYLSKKVDHTVINHEISQVEELNVKFRQYGFFSKEGYRKEGISEDIILYSLDDLYFLR